MATMKEIVLGASLVAATVFAAGCATQTDNGTAPTAVSGDYGVSAKDRARCKSATCKARKKATSANQDQQ